MLWTARQIFENHRKKAWVRYMPLYVLFAHGLSSYEDNQVSKWVRYIGRSGLYEQRY